MSQPLNTGEPLLFGGAVSNDTVRPSSGKEGPDCLLHCFVVTCQPALNGLAWSAISISELVPLCTWATSKRSPALRTEEHMYMQ